MARGIFVTGTDTGVGKTVASVALLRGLARSGLRAVGMKPVSAGRAVDGGQVTVVVSELDRTFKTEYVGSGLEAGDTVIVQVQGDDASLEYTAPEWVRLVTSIKDLVP